MKWPQCKLYVGVVSQNVLQINKKFKNCISLDLLQNDKSQFA